MKNIKGSLKLLCLLLLMISLVSTSGCLRSFEEESQLQIINIDVMATDVRSAFVDLNVTMYVENYGETASNNNTTMILKAYNTRTGLLEIEKESPIGNIPAESAREVTVPVNLPKKDGYRVVALVFEDGSRKTGRQITLNNIEDLQGSLETPGVEISEMDFMVMEVAENKVLIQNDIYLTNEGVGENKNYRMLVKAREMDAGLIADKAWTETGMFAPDETVIRSVNLSVPDNYNYAVEIILWENNNIVRQGVDYVQLNPEKDIDKDKRLQTKDIDSGDFVVEGFGEAPVEEESASEYPTEEPMGAPGPGVFGALVMLCMVYFVARRNKDE
ncbi:DUF7490 domain-containing protein [Methanohalophilus profundi]|uniref:DUF7490 domain-containing protein n=1 Tax=Methanohalophilus profundi TaxID=2138083 RepID=UPI00101BA0F8|nr:hypothetical protein [Methanohalophilus profundi]